MSHVIEQIDSVVTEPQQPALTVEYAKRHIRALTASDDRLIEIWIQAATQYFEAQTGRQLVTSTRQLLLPCFPNMGPYTLVPSVRGYGLGAGVKIELPRPPLQAVTAVEYLAADGTLTSFVDESVSPSTPLYATTIPTGIYARRGSIEPLFNTAWPQTQYQTGAVRITYRCGYGDDEDAIPDLARGALCYLVGHFDRFRTPVEALQSGSLATVPLGFDELIKEFKYQSKPSIEPRLRNWY